MKKISCLIVDDEPLALKLVEGYVNKTPFLELKGTCASAIEAMGFLENEAIDLLFLDIQMPDLNGIEFSKMLKKGPRVIFTTAFEQYALQGYKVDALDYLLKPFNYEEFLKAALKAKDWFLISEQAKQKDNQLKEIFVKSEYKLVKITLDEVLFFEGLKDYVKIHFDNQEKAVMSLMSLKTLEEQLPESQFLRVHRSFIVNLSRIETIERSRIIFGKNMIPVADNYKEKFQQFIASRTFDNSKK